MSDIARDVYGAVTRLRRRDPTFRWIFLYGKQYTDAELDELADCLPAHPDAVMTAELGFNRLTDETGVKLSRYIAASSTIQALSLSSNQFGEATYLALAKTLRVNSSLRELFLQNNQAVDRARIDAAFVEALRLNPDRPAESVWWLYSSFQDDLSRLRAVAFELGSPSMLAQLDFAQDCLPSTKVRK